MRRVILFIYTPEAFADRGFSYYFCIIVFVLRIVDDQGKKGCLFQQKYGALVIKTWKARKTCEKTAFCFS